jgi:hypothetical protein
MIGEDPYSTLYLGEWVGGMISGATIQVAIRAVRPNLPQIALEQIKDEISTVGVHMHPNVVRLLGVSYLNQQNLTAVFDYMVG